MPTEQGAARGALERATRGALLGWHKALGALILVYGLWRVGWRLWAGFPASAATMPPRQERAAKIVHWALLAAVVLVPLSGVVMTLLGGRPLDVLGLVIPALGEIEWLHEGAELVHGLAGKAVVLLLVLHIGGALKHQ